MPQDTKQPLIDTAQLRMLLFTRIIPYGGGTVVLCAFLYWLSNSVMTTGLDLPPLVAAEGVVLINGEPRAGVMISMRPYDEDTRGKWRASNAVTDERGRFRMMFMEGYPGVVPGKVQLAMSYMEEGREVMASEYLEPGKLIEIPPRGDRNMKIETTTQGPR